MKVNGQMTKKHDMACIRSGPYVTHTVYSRLSNSRWRQMHILSTFLSRSLCTEVHFVCRMFSCVLMHKISFPLHLNSPSGLLPQSSKSVFSHLELKMGSYYKCRQLVLHANTILTKDVCVCVYVNAKCWQHAEQTIIDIQPYVEQLELHAH